MEDKTLHSIGDNGNREKFRIIAVKKDVLFMMPVMEKNPEFLAVEPLPHWTAEKMEIASSAALDTECACATQHMFVHDAMCPHCWKRLLARNGN